MKLIAKRLGCSCSLFYLLIAGGLLAQDGSAKPQQREWKLGEATRTAIVFAPDSAKTESTPIVFGFHGHGGRAQLMVNKFGIQKHWPEAIVVYMQGLPTPGMTDPKGLKSGWQKDEGDQADRDLKFFDAVLETLKKEYKVDSQRIYAMGHSNGGAFTYLLWRERPDLFAAIAPSAAGIRATRETFQPLPVMHLASKSDQIVPYATQERTLNRIRELNGCPEQGVEWAKGCLEYKSEQRPPLVTLLHEGGHQYPDAAPPLIVKFFKEHTRK